MAIYRLADDTTQNFEVFTCKIPGASLRISDWAIKGHDLDLSGISLSRLESKWRSSFGPTLRTDFMKLYGIVLVFSDDTLKKIGSRLSECGEALPISSDAGQYHIYRVSKIIDCVDIESSDAKIDRRGFITEYHSLALAPPDDPELFIFRVPQLITEVFVSDQFRQEVVDAGLTGFSLADSSTPPTSSDSPRL